MQRYNISFNSAIGTNEFVKETQFGANALHSINIDYDTSGDPLTSGFEASLDAYEITHLRYPGGHVENTLDVTRLDNGRLREEVRSFMEWCKANSSLSHKYQVTFVLPTKSNIPSQQIEDFVYLLISSYGENIKALEIGNEYSIGQNVDSPDRSTHPENNSGSDFIAAMNESEYGMAAENVITASQNALDRIAREELNNVQEPLILLQMAETNGGASSYKRGQDSGNFHLANEAILEHLSPRSLDAIDGTVAHYYYDVSRDEGETFDNVEDWRETRRIEERYDDFIEQLGRDVDLFVTEWNVQASNYSQLGATSSSVLLEMFEFMVRLGVDDAHIWPLQHRTTNSIFGNRQSNDLEYSMSGATFAMLAENLRPQESETGRLDSFESQLSDWTNLPSSVEVNHFSSFYRDVVYLSLRANQAADITLDLGELLNQDSLLEIERLTIEPNSSDGLSDFADYQGKNRIAQRVITLSELERLETLPFFDPDNVNHVRYNGERIQTYLPPFETILPLVAHPETIHDYWFTAEVDVDPLKIQVAAPDSFTQPLQVQLLPYDVLQVKIDNVQRQEGSVSRDRLNGGIGRDFLVGRAENDSLNGGEGSDTLKGGSGHDVLIGGDGDDELFDGPGDDVLNTGAGQDTAKSSGGVDFLQMGDGSDAVELRSDSVFFGGTAAFHALTAGNNPWHVNIEGMARYQVVTHGGGGKDRIELGDGDDAFFLEDTLSGFHQLLGSAPVARVNGVEIIRAGDGDDILDMTSLRFDHNTPGMELFGQEGDDTLWGTAGDDSLLGGPGHDVLEGGLGQDIMTGGTGADAFHFVQPSSSTQIITDFEVDDGDTIVLHGIVPSNLQVTAQGTVLNVVSVASDFRLAIDVGEQANFLAAQNNNFAEWLDFF